MSRNVSAINTTGLKINRVSLNVKLSALSHGADPLKEQ